MILQVITEEHIKADSGLKLALQVCEFERAF